MKAIKKILTSEPAPGILLGLAALIALIAKNSPVSRIYDALTREPALFLVNDCIMSIFFLLVGLEIKREICDGRLSEKSQIALPLLAAIGGMMMPAIIYICINWGDQTAIKGWAIPTATDIAFALGVVTLLGNRVSSGIKVCLLTLAILDDLVAVGIIAICYTKNISFAWLAAAVWVSIILLVLNRRTVKTLAPYLTAGLLLWICVFNSGIHASIAGVILAFFIPLKIGDARPLTKLEYALSPWVSYGILPVFALTNTGIPLESVSVDLLTSPITLGTASGLFCGKQAGVMLLSAIGVRVGLCKLPKHVTWMEYYGMALITGVGFTMSLFVGTLAFNDLRIQTAVRLGILIGSLASGLTGYFVLRWFSGRSPRKKSLSTTIE